MPTPIDSTIIIDSVTIANTKVVALVPNVALTPLYQSIAKALGMSLLQTTMGVAKHYPVFKLQRPKTSHYRH